MKYALLLLALLAAPAPAHEKHKASPQKAAPLGKQEPARPAVPEAEVFKSHLGQPEYWHLLSNPIPSLGLGVATALQAASFVPAAQALAVPGLVVGALAGLSVIFVIHSGQEAYDRLFERLPVEAQQWLDVHMARAEKRQFLFYLTAAMAIAALVQLRRRHRSAKWLRLAALLLTAASAGLAGWIGHAGGQVAHAEFRMGPPTAEDLRFVEGN